jgi:tetratricopeptide (TPR) repeat protein
MIAGLDAQFASGGAGANRKLKADAAASSFVLSPGSSIFPDSSLLDWGQAKNPQFPAGQTPAEAFAIMQAALRDRGDVRDSMYFDRIKGKSFQVLQNENRAIIYFGGNSEEENTPFFFAKTSSGWIFDLVNQARYVRYGPGHHWGIELGDSDYAPLLDKCSFSWWLDMDIPWEEEDIYRPENDTQIVSRILELQPQYQKNQDDFETALDLGRLGVLIGRQAPQVVPYLQKAKKLRPQSPQPYKYLAILYVIRFEHKKAMAELEEMLKRDPESLFARKFLGHLYTVVKDYDSAIRQLGDALQIDPHDCYALTYLSYAYAGRFQAGGSANDKKKAAELMPRCEARCYRTYRRAWWLKNHLWDIGIISKEDQSLAGLSFYWYNYQDGKGVLVYDVKPGQPADAAGVQEGDFIMAFNGQPIHDNFQLFELFGLQKPGQKVKLEIIRGALKGPLSLGDITVNPKTYGLSQPQRLTMAMTMGRKE